MNKSAFKENILAVANQIRKANGFRESNKVDDAVELLLTHIIRYVQTNSSHYPVEGHIKDSDAEFADLMDNNVLANELLSTYLRFFPEN